jgi:hypothetical protein
MQVIFHYSNTKEFLFNSTMMLSNVSDDLAICLSALEDATNFYGSTVG